eukprot:gene3484-3722_t
MPLISADLPIHQIRSPESKRILWNMKNNLNHAELVQCVDFSDVRSPPIPRVKEFYLCKCERLTDVRSLSHLEQLQIINASELEDLSPLRNIPKIKLFYLPKACDFSMFNSNNQSDLSIINCEKISSVESFRMIRKLEITNCLNITDVSCLYGIHCLTLQNLPNVKDISGLGGHHRINLDIGYYVSGYKCLYNIPHVSLTANLTDITMLRNAKTARLTGCNELKDVSPLANATEVCFNWCFRYGIKTLDIRSLRNVPRLKIFKSNNIYSSDQMKNQFVNFVSDFGGVGGKFITNLQPFLHVGNLSLTLLPSSEEHLMAYEYLLSSHNLQSLTLDGYTGEIDRFVVLGYISRVTLKSLKTKNITCLGKTNRYVELNMCT